MIARAGLAVLIVATLCSKKEQCLTALMAQKHIHPKPRVNTTEISRSFCLRLAMMMPTTADAWAIFDSAISGHTGAAHALDHLHIDSEGGLVDTGNHQRRVEEAEQRGADRREAAG